MESGSDAADRNEMHYDYLDRVDWSRRGDYMQQRHGITPQIANDVLRDPDRVVIDPDYNSTSGQSIRVIGASVIAGEIITVIVLADDGHVYGVNGWVANQKDRRIYNEGSAHEQED